ncbi:MAG: hypothetical protein U0796_17940 [Gemmatales bacterium]
MSITNEVTLWAGQKLSDGPIVLLPDSTSGQLVAGSSDYTSVVSVIPEQFEEFVNMHADSVFLSVDVASIFWRLDLLLKSSINRHSRAMLWQLVEEERWIDVPLLRDQVIRAYEMRGRPIPRQIAHYNNIAYLMVPDRFYLFIRLFKRLNSLSHLLAKDATTVLPFKNYDLLSRQRLPKIIRIK